jgi:O-antigen ligase
MKSYQNRSGELVLIWALLLTTLGVTPFYSFDPINLFRFIIVFASGVAAIGLILLKRQDLFARANLLVLIISCLFLIQTTLTTIKSKLNLVESIFGVAGRNTGALTYLSLLSLMILALLYSNKSALISITKILILCGVISSCYGIIQALEFDPFNWINPYSPVFGFFGNPNFLSSFMGITSTAALSSFLQRSDFNLRKISLFTYVALSLFVVYLSKSQQGYLVFASGASVVIYFWIKNHNKLSKITPLYILSWLVGVVLVLIDILQKSPWSPIIYKESVTFRGDFWRTGWNITKDQPLFGVGLDGYRENYRLYRDQIAADRNPTTVVDSAHNVFLDISSGGGFPLLIIYCSLILLVMISIAKVIRREKEFNAPFAAVCGAWVAYQAQSIISINQIGLAIWGWVLSGLIIGYEINTRNEGSSSAVSNKSAERIAIVSGLILGVIISLPLLLVDGQFRSTVRAGDVITIEKNLDQWPQNVIRMNLAAQIFVDGGFADRALVISQKAVKLNPRNFEAWQMIYLNPESDENSKAQALSKMRELDPLNPNLK